MLSYRYLSSKLTVRNMPIGVIAILAPLIVYYTIGLADFARKNRDNALRVAASTEVSGLLFNASAHLAAERALVEVAFARDEPVDAATAKKVKHHRHMAHTKNEAVLGRLGGDFAFALTSGEFKEMEAAHDAVMALRPEVDRTLADGRMRRDPALAGEWRRESARLTAAIERLVTAIEFRPDEALNAIQAQYAMRRALWAVGEYLGHERISSAVSSRAARTCLPMICRGRPLSREGRASLEQSRSLCAPP